MSTQHVPTLYDWLGGIDALNRLTVRLKTFASSASVVARTPKSFNSRTFASIYTVMRDLMHVYVVPSILA